MTWKMLGLGQFFFKLAKVQSLLGWKKNIIVQLTSEKEDGSWDDPITNIVANFEIGGQQVLKNKRKLLKNVVKLSLQFSTVHRIRKPRQSTVLAQGMNENLKMNVYKIKKTLLQGFIQLGLY